jgi:hypothetical protein
MHLYLGQESKWSSGQVDRSARLTIFDYDVNRITATTLAGAEGRKKLRHIGRQRLTRGAQPQGREEWGSTVEPARTEEAICWLREGVGSGEGGGACCVSASTEDSTCWAGVNAGAEEDDGKGEYTVAGAGAVVGDGVTSG